MPPGLGDVLGVGPAEVEGVGVPTGSSPVAGPRAEPTRAPAHRVPGSTEHRGETVKSANPATCTADIPALLERGRTLAMPVLRAAVDRLVPPMDTVAAYHFGWIDAAGRPAFGDGGKAVRPALALLSAEAAGAEPEVGIPGAVAVELVHNFSLLHDDLMDGDEQRRHRDTVWKVHGPAQAILVGDALFALATEVLLELGTADAARAARRLTTASRRLIDGQAQDISYEHRERVTVEECLEMEGNKTGALIACSVSIGAVLGGADDRTADVLATYGHHLGLAFQAVDDLLGIWGDPQATGKRTWSDLRQRKKSLPVVAALAAGGPASEHLAKILAADARSDQEDDFDETEFASRAALIEEAGGRAWTFEEAGRQHAQAIDALDRITMPAHVRAQFTALADFVIVREK